MAAEQELAALAYLSYDLSNKNRILLPGWTNFSPVVNLGTGFAATVSTNGSEIVIAFRGTDTEDWTDWTQANLPAVFGARRTLGAGHAIRGY